MNFEELLNVEPDQIGRKLAAVAVLTSRTQKTADLQSIINSIKDRVSTAGAHAVTELTNGNPVYTGAAGALGLGGLSALRETMRPRKDRNYGNALTAAMLGGAAGAAVPMLGGLKDAIPEGIAKTDGVVDKGLQGMAGTVTKAVNSTPVGVNSALGVGATAALRSGYPDTPGRALIRGGMAELGKPSTGPVITGQPNNDAFRDSLDRVRTSGMDSWNPKRMAEGMVDSHLAAKHGLPDVQAINAARPTALQPGQSPYDGTNRWRSLLTGSAPTMPNQAGARIPLPVLGQNPAHARTVVQGLRQNATKAPWSAAASMVPAALGIGSDIYKGFGLGQ